MVCGDAASIPCESAMTSSDVGEGAKGLEAKSHHHQSSGSHKHPASIPDIMALSHPFWMIFLMVQLFRRVRPNFE